VTEASSPDWGKSIVEGSSTIDYSYVRRIIHLFCELFRLDNKCITTGNIWHNDFNSNHFSDNYNCFISDMLGVINDP